MKISARWALCLLLLGLVSLSVANREMEDDLEDMDEGGMDEGAMDDEDSEEKPAPGESEAQKERPVYQTPIPKGKAYFVDTFDDSSIGEKWILSQAKKDEADENIAKYNGEWSIEEPSDSPLVGDQGLVLKERAKHHAVSANLDETFEFRDKSFIVQYEVKFQNGQECGGAYVKLLTEDKSFDPVNFADKTAYTIMFGPDKCGNDNKLHFIFRHKNPITGKFEEKHAKKPTAELASFFTDKKTHLYTLVLHPDNTFEIFVDQVLVNSGSLLEDVEPAVNPPKEIKDPNDKKPANWDEREKIQDPEASKPEDWDENAPETIEDDDAIKPEGWLDDEPELTADPDAEKPSDWDEDMDGEWEPPMVNNPKCESAPGCGEWKRPTKKNPEYKGKWKAPMIDNPSYQGKWKARMIENPDFFEDLDPFTTMTSISALGLELWSMSDDIYFDNFIITDDKVVADQFASESWELKSAQETSGGLSGKSVVQAVLDATKERPWLWVVFILVVVLPVVLVIAYCCMSSPSKPDDVRRHKKTDEGTQPDDEPEDDDEGDDEVDEGASGDAKSKPKATDKKKSSKGALEAEESADESVSNVTQEDLMRSPYAFPEFDLLESSSSDPDIELDGFESYDSSSSSSLSSSELQLSTETLKAEEADAEDEEEKPAEKATPTRSSPRKRKTKPQKE